MDEIKKIIVNSPQGQKVYGIEDSEVRQDVQQIVEGAPEAFDTFKEIAEYIAEDGATAAEIIKNVAANADAIAEESTRAKEAEEELLEVATANFEDIKTLQIEKADKSLAMQYNTLGVNVYEDKAELYCRSISGETRTMDFPAATEERAGVMSAADKVALDTATSRALRTLFIAAGAEYNDTDQIIQKTAPWETEEKWRLEDDGTYTYWEEPAIVDHLPKHYYLNGLGDITEEQMMTIYIETFPLSKNPYWLNALRGAISRTNIFPKFLYASQIVKDLSASFYSYKTDVICLNAGNYNITTSLEKQTSHTFYECSVKRVIGVIDFVNTQPSAYGEKCSNLIDFKMKNIKSGNHKTFGSSPNISKRSVLYLIQNASPTTAITVTLHPDAYARIANQPDIVAALEAQPLITLVSA